MSRPLNVSRAELMTLKKLSRNKDIVIVRPDKGNGIVILDKIDYINKVEFLLSDKCKFRKLDVDVDVLDICIKREGQLICILRDTLLKNKSISESVYHDLPLKAVSLVFYMAFLRFIRRIVLLGLLCQLLELISII